MSLNVTRGVQVEHLPYQLVLHLLPNDVLLVAMGPQCLRDLQITKYSDCSLISSGFIYCFIYCMVHMARDTLDRASICATDVRLSLRHDGCGLS